MPEHCTCGAELPPEARFCHKCGKPQREEDRAAEAPVEHPPLPQPPPSVAAAIDFRNSLAVRVGLFSALMATLLNLVLVYACPLWLMAAGFLGVYLYERRTGQELTVGNGARMGWIAGLFSFVIFTVVFTFSFVMAVRSGELFNQLGNLPFFQGNAEQLRELFNSPAYLAMNVVLSLVVLFVVFTAFTVAGGALGAKVLSKERT